MPDVNVAECTGYQSVQASTIDIVQRDLLTENTPVSDPDEV